MAATVWCRGVVVVNCGLLAHWSRRESGVRRLITRGRDVGDPKLSCLVPVENLEPVICLFLDLDLMVGITIVGTSIDLWPVVEGWRSLVVPRQRRCWPSRHQRSSHTDTTGERVRAGIEYWLRYY